MTRIYALLFAVALTLNACATAGPIAVKCGLQDIAIAAADYAQIAADIHAKNWDDLAKEGEKLGWATLDCVLGDQVAQNPGVKANVDEFKRLKSVEFRAAGVSASKDSRSPIETVASGDNGLLVDGAAISFLSADGPPPQIVLGIVGGYSGSWEGPRVAFYSEALPISLAVPVGAEMMARQRVGHSACDQACGKEFSGLATPSGCSCWRESKTDWRASRWVAAGGRL